MSRLKEGDFAPDFELPAQNGKEVSLGNYVNRKNVVLYFYPKDDTPGCTAEACGFRDAMDELYDNDTTVLGVSPDSISQHQKFAAKYDLPFLLVSDEKKTLSKKYGVWVEKNMYGRKYMGVERTTFVIDREGRIAKIYKNVKPKGHNEEILGFIKSIPGLADAHH